MSDGHGNGCHTAAAVRFAKPDEVPAPTALAAGAVAGVLSDCTKHRCSPDGVISVAIGPCRELLGLWERVTEPGADGVASLAAADQVAATIKAEPDRFAALAFAHVSPRPVQS